jgi:hypothetical protein
MNEPEQPVQRGYRTIFSWEKRGGSRVVLAGFLFISALLHAALFALFQIARPAQASLPPAAPPVSLLVPGDPESDALLAWIDVEDPALTVSLDEEAPARIWQSEYAPSFNTPRTAPRLPAEPTPTIQYPPAREPLELIATAAHLPVPPAAKPVVPPETRVIFSATLSPRAPGSLPTIKPPPAPAPAAPLEPASFLLGVNERGEVRHCLLQHGSGNAEADRAAQRQLERLTFSKNGAELTWGLATIDWGA